MSSATTTSCGMSVYTHYIASKADLTLPSLGGGVTSHAGLHQISSPELGEGRGGGLFTTPHPSMRAPLCSTLLGALRTTRPSPWAPKSPSSQKHTEVGRNAVKAVMKGAANVCLRVCTRRCPLSATWGSTALAKHSGRRRHWDAGRE